VREGVAPIYLFLCLILGGSAQGIWGNMVLELIGIAVIAWAAIAPADEPMARPARRLFVLVVAGLILIVVQLVPLAPAVWPSLGGRTVIAQGYEVLGLSVPWLPLSLAPYDSVAALVELIPPIALLCAILRLKAYRPSWLALALLAGALAGILLGVLQAASAEPQTSPWYIYRDSSFGVATGFFANANHMAMLLIASIPFLAALLASARGGNVQRLSATAALVGGMMLVVIVGLALNRSIAGYILTVPVVAASALIIFRLKTGTARGLALGAAGLLVAAIILLVSTPVADKALGTSASVGSRAEIMGRTLDAATDFMPFGSGLGTFRPVYRLYENHDTIERTYVNHAHNDYLELALETGIAGIALLMLFLAWWGSAAWRAWRAPDSAPFARAASIASAALLIHSSVEFPLRSVALSAVFAVCLALLVVRRRATAESDKSHLWPTRHVVMR
jgi:O-antigen ligase